MNRKQRIKNLLSDKLSNFSIEIIDNSKIHAGHGNFNGNNETHIKLLLKKNFSQKINRLDIHRFINKLLTKEFENGLHSLEINII